MPATSEKQARFMRAVRGCQEGGTCKGAVKRAAKSMTKKQTSEFTHTESADRQHIKEFIKNICETDFANANKALAAAVREKVKNAIRGVEQ